MCVCVCVCVDIYYLRSTYLDASGVIFSNVLSS